MTISKDQIIANLKEVYDPEMLSLNIYDLGLIYDIRIDEKDKWVEITHTLTSAFCPFAEQIVADITKAGYVPEVLAVEVVTTFDPPFTMDSVSDDIKMIMGWDYSLNPYE
jgi:metal-sulfur cluster biosynthetic enzyme